MCGATWRLLPLGGSNPLLKDWFGLAMLAAESQQVIWLRLMKLSAGGPKAESEARLMLTEKFAAASKATAHLMMGGNPDSLVKSYRRKVRANARRLSK